MQAVSIIAKGEDSLASKINFDLCLCEGILSRFARTIWLLWQFLTIARGGISFFQPIGPHR